MEAVLAGVDEWRFDAFKLEEVRQGGRGSLVRGGTVSGREGGRKGGGEAVVCLCASLGPLPDTT
jgi:hypothetical protein